MTWRSSRRSMMPSISGHGPIVVEVPLGLVGFDGEQARRGTPHYIYSDLLFFSSLGGSSPGAVGGRLGNGRVQVQSRARYAAIAQDLGLAAVVCFLPADTPRSLLDEFLLTPGVRLIGAPGLDDYGPSVQWHTVAFDEDVPGDELARIGRALSEVFGQPVDPHRGGPDGRTIYFQALTREDHDQAVSFYAALREFDQEIAPIRSYRGGRFARFP
jgi:hypothetical protein